LLEADTVGVRAIPLLQVLLGIHLNSPPFWASCVYQNAHFYCSCTLCRLLHIPARLVKEVMRIDGVWWTGWSCRVYKCVVNTILKFRDINL
jgi:hypothetical protein